MDINQLKAYIHKNFVISEYLTSEEMQSYMDDAINDINNALQATFPTFSEWPKYVEIYNMAHVDSFLDNAVYTAFPKRYLQNVVAVGAALKFFTNDEEGEFVSGRYNIDYDRNMSLMVRDYIHLVPEEFQNNEGGYVEVAENRTTADIEVPHGGTFL